MLSTSTCFTLNLHSSLENTRHDKYNLVPCMVSQTVANKLNVPLQTRLGKHWWSRRATSMGLVHCSLPRHQKPRENHSYSNLCDLGVLNRIRCQIHLQQPIHIFRRLDSAGYLCKDLIEVLRQGFQDLFPAAQQQLQRKFEWQSWHIVQDDVAPHPCSCICGQYIDENVDHPILNNHRGKVNTGFTQFDSYVRARFSYHGAQLICRTLNGLKEFQAVRVEHVFLSARDGADMTPIESIATGLLTYCIPTVYPIDPSLYRVMTQTIKNLKHTSSEKTKP